MPVLSGFQTVPPGGAAPAAGLPALPSLPKLPRATDPGPVVNRPAMDGGNNHRVPPARANVA